MQYTVFNLQGINQLCSQYDIGTIISHKVLSGGSENTNYLICSTKEKFVLTICEQKSVVETTQLTQLLEHLSDNGFTSSEIIRTKKGEPILVHQDKPILLKTFLKGTTISNLPNHLLTLIGVQLGKLHQIKAPDYLPQQLNYGMEYFDEVGLYAKKSPFYKWLMEKHQQIKPYISETTPKALIHSDLFYSNVIINTNQSSVVLMDFEEATYYYRIFDVGMAIVGLCRQEKAVHLDKVSSLLKGYTQEIELTTAEKKALQTFTVYAATAMSFWRHKNFNYTNPTPSMKDHYLELKAVSDYINDLPPQSFEELL